MDTKKGKSKANSFLSIEDVSIFYNKKKVINSLSLQISAGSCFGLLGLNGAGKTTLIKSITSLRDPDLGTIQLKEKNVIEPESRKQIAYLPEKFEPSSFLTGIEFLHFVLRLYNKRPSDTAIYEFAETFQLAPDILKKRVKTYSKGMRQKLGLLSVFLTDCPLLILDEPMSGLDPRARAVVKNAIRSSRQSGRTVFLSSHILSDVDVLCSEVGILRDGCLAFTGSPDSLLAHTGCTDVETAFLHVVDSVTKEAA